jgi:hypothetical protein
VRVRGGHQQVAIFGRKAGGHTVRLAGYCLDVGLPVPHGCYQPFSLRLCPWLQRHGVTIPSLLDQAQGVLLAGLMVIILAGGEGALTIGRRLRGVSEWS